MMRRADMPKEEFGREYLLTLGEIYGVRNFGVSGGKLTAVFNPLIAWEPGVNTARCYVDHYKTGWLPYYVKPVYSVFGFAWAFHEWNLEKEPPKHAEAPNEECTCGFYAYGDPARIGSGSVRGIVRITGRTLIGERGYRFEKGEIVALLDPTKQSETPDVPWRRNALRVVKEHYSHIPLFEAPEAMYEAFPPTPVEKA